MHSLPLPAHGRRKICWPSFLAMFAIIGVLAFSSPPPAHATQLTAAHPAAANAGKSLHNFLVFFAGGTTENFYLAKGGKPAIILPGQRVTTCEDTDENDKPQPHMSACDRSSHFYEEDLGTIGVAGYEPYPNPMQNKHFKGDTMARIWYMSWNPKEKQWHRTTYCLGAFADMPHYVGSSITLHTCKVGKITWETMWQMPEPVISDYPAFGTIGLVNFGMTRAYAGIHPVSDSQFAMFSNFRRDAPQVFIHQYSASLTTVEKAFNFAWIPTRVETPAIEGACVSAARTWPGEGRHRKESCSHKLIPDNIKIIGAHIKLDGSTVIARLKVKTLITPQKVQIATTLQYFNPDTRKWAPAHDQSAIALYTVHNLPPPGDERYLVPQVEATCDQTSSTTHMHFRLSLAIAGVSDTGEVFPVKDVNLPRRGIAIRCPR